jgi:hypothetical protein
MRSSRVQRDALAWGSKASNSTLRQMQRETSTDPARIVIRTPYRHTALPPYRLSSWVGGPDVELADHGAIGQTHGMHDGRGDIVRLKDPLRF